MRRCEKPFRQRFEAKYAEPCRLVCERPLPLALGPMIYSDPYFRWLPRVQDSLNYPPICGPRIITPDENLVRRLRNEGPKVLAKCPEALKIGYASRNFVT